jgi:transcription termination factor NusB
LYRPDTPTGVILAEAVDLAATYSSPEAKRFVNGVLAEAGRRYRADA